jgi:hypothetical protein
MDDTSGHDATRRDDLHTMTLKELEAQIIQAGIVMSRRQIMRHCKAGTFDAQKVARHQQCRGMVHLSRIGGQRYRRHKNTSGF